MQDTAVCPLPRHSWQRSSGRWGSAGCVWMAMSGVGAFDVACGWRWFGWNGRGARWDCALWLPGRWARDAMASGLMGTRDSRGSTLCGGWGWGRLSLWWRGEMGFLSVLFSRITARFFRLPRSWLIDNLLPEGMSRIYGTEVVIRGVWLVTGNITGGVWGMTSPSVIGMGGCVSLAKLQF